ncbi:alpha/beta fold hydrolase [Erwiniaceae bacterium BAC15a-03b]|uniref:Alpha/beta fold hydrolase n=1 Tax=Winslowiella arboricola TaxID=2978220 RepID=A0A9J6PMV5_9GAMM|nr:alpha/beta fold hydrolase [Winslowiella arboricola]MCU5774075.1 alpha/beta fold hydrolase [Winslowiella arboricola]MCU5776992.1 alpha/beta fold hydrolase [Winslowiella arboricola]
MANPILSGLAGCVLLIASPFTHAQTKIPAPQEGNWIAPEFTFNNGEKLKNLKIHYYTLGDRSKPAILLLHGTNQPIKALLADNFGGELFGPGQALDSSKYFIIMPESIGSGKSSRPSDGLRMKFPQYDYNDMVLAQYRLLKEGLGINHLRLVMGYSMGGMQTWIWGEKYPQMMDALVPMASQPNELSGRNWMMRRMLIESIKNDPAWNQGNYTQQPPVLKSASIMFSIATTGGTLAYQNKAPTRAMADKLIDERLAAPATSDANDFIYIWGSSANYNALPELNRIKAPMLIINSEDDERNPVETGILAGELDKIKQAELLLIPASKETSGHGTMMSAKFYQDKLKTFLTTSE